MSEREDRRRPKEVIELITFPASKNFPPANELKGLSFSDDPLEELLNEFGPYEEYLEQIASADLDEPALLEWLGINSEHYIWLGEHDPVQFQGEQVKLLREIGYRLKYYLDEIEQVLPTK